MSDSLHRPTQPEQPVQGTYQAANQAVDQTNSDPVKDLTQFWLVQIASALPQQPPEIHRAIAQWLIGPTERFEAMSAPEIGLAKNAMDYRYRIFISRYWNLPPERAYQSMLGKLGSSFVVRSKIRTWIALSRDRKRAVNDVLQEIIQEMLQSDRYMREQTQWIKQCTDRLNLRNSLTLATIEEYCMRPIRNQPLLVYRFVNYLKRSQRGGMTQVPSAETIQLISEEIGMDDSEGTFSLLDFEALEQYEIEQDKQQQEVNRQLVKQQFADYLQDKLGDTAVQWLDLHLQGYAQDSISRQLGLNVREAYRLREKVSYHAIRIFTLKEQPDMVFGWLKTSLKHHNFGLTPSEWDKYWKSLSPQQQTLLNEFKAGKTIEDIAKALGLTQRQVASKWADLYLLAQEARTAKD